MGPDWIEHNGNQVVLGNRGHNIGSFSMMSHASASSPYIGSTISSRFDHGGSGVTFVGLVAGFASTSIHVFVKIQDNGGDGLYDRVFFYQGTGNTWGASTYYYDLATPMVSGIVTLSFDAIGDVAILEVANDASTVVETFTADNLLNIASSLGTGFGIRSYGDAYFDDVSINDGCGPSGPTYSIANLVGGSTATLTVDGATAGATVLIGYSLTGSGPTLTPFGSVDMSLPITRLPVLTVDGAGVATMTTGVPVRGIGFTVTRKLLTLRPTP